MVAYYQETGRAGRDGHVSLSSQCRTGTDIQMARCIFYYCTSGNRDPEPADPQLERTLEIDGRWSTRLLKRRSLNVIRKVRRTLGKTSQGGIQTVSNR